MIEEPGTKSSRQMAQVSCENVSRLLRGAGSKFGQISSRTADDISSSSCSPRADWEADAASTSTTGFAATGAGLEGSLATEPGGVLSEGDGGFVVERSGYI